MELLGRWPRQIAALFILALVAACGGSGTNNNSDLVDTGPPPPAASTGTVGIMFTDMPSDDFDQIIATVAGIELLGESGRATIFSGPPQDVDFLKLESFTEVFAVADNVPAGDYNGTPPDLVVRA